MRQTPQSLLFGGGQMEPPDIPAEVREMREWDESLFLSYEKDALGFYITGHPLAQFEKRLKKLTSHSLSQLDEEQDFNSEIRVAGIISSLKSLKTRKDEQFVTFILEDLSGRIDVVAFPDSYNKYYEILREANLVWVKGRFMGEGENRRVSLVEVMPLQEAFQKQAKRVILRIFLPGLEQSVVQELKELLEKNPGQCPVFFELETPHSYRVVAQSLEVRGVVPSEDLSRSVERLLGEDSVLIEY
jgi:DNA polymerase-3 subunit alpha